MNVRLSWKNWESMISEFKTRPLADARGYVLSPLRGSERRFTRN